MISIRKFVGYAGAAAGLSAVMALAMSTQTGIAYTASLQPSSEPAVTDNDTTQATLSPACTAAIANLKAAFVADATEDKSEYATARLNGGSETDNDSAEASNFMTLWNAVRSGCAPTASAGSTVPPVAHTYTLSATCKADLAALKAAWEQHPTTRAQWQQLQSLAQAARAACGWTSGSPWSSGWSR